MSKFSVDYKSVEDKLYKKVYRLSEVNDKIEKVAFDIVRFRDDDNASRLWQIHSADDGDYIIALYDTEEDVVKTSSEKSKWSVSINKISKDLNVYYNGDPIVRISSDSLGIPESEIHLTARYLPSRLSENKKLVRALLNNLDELTKKDVLSKYPELF
jgi:hypothetical protein